MFTQETTLSNGNCRPRNIDGDAARRSSMNPSGLPKEMRLTSDPTGKQWHEIDRDRRSQAMPDQHEPSPRRHRPPHVSEDGRPALTIPEVSPRHPVELHECRTEQGMGAPPPYMRIRVLDQQVPPLDLPSGEGVAAATRGWPRGTRVQVHRIGTAIARESRMVVRRHYLLCAQGW